MKKITLLSDEWQAIVEAIHFAVSHHNERVAYYLEKGDDLSAKAIGRQSKRYRSVRDKIVEQTEMKL